MPKFYASGLLCYLLMFGPIVVIGQNQKGPNVLAAGCDTINFPIPSNWGRATYAITSGNTGFWTGTNSFGDKEKAHFFDQTGTSNIYLTRCFIHFGKATSANPANLNKTIIIKVYDGTTNTPGGLLGSTSTTLGNIQIDVNLNDKTDIVFPSAIALPASKKFFVSVDFSSLSWNTDSLVIYSSLSGRTPNYTWEKWSNNTWHQTSEESALNLSLYINPFLSTNTTCQVVQPVQLSGFNGALTNKGHLLQWTTVSEQMNKGFYVEYSNNGQQFTTIGFVPSGAVNGNSSLSLNYSFLYQPSSNGSESFYRLKQQDLNGSTVYSKQIRLRNTAFENAEIGRIYPNPVANMLIVEWIKSVQKDSQLRIVDATGRIVKQFLLAVTGKQTNIPMEGLAGGMYVLQVLDNKQQVTDSEKFWIK